MPRLSNCKAPNYSYNVSYVLTSQFNREQIVILSLFFTILKYIEVGKQLDFTANIMLRVLDKLTYRRLINRRLVNLNMASFKQIRKRSMPDRIWTLL